MIGTLAISNYKIFRKLRGGCYTDCMHIQIISVGKASDRSVSALTDEYEKRLSRWTAVTWRLLPSGRTKDEESAAIMKLLKPTDYVVLLDERGTLATTEAITRELEKWLGSGRPIVLIIGGAFGVSGALLDRADFVWSFSKLVFPHQLMRVLLVEQLYRLFNYRDGGKYHH